MRFRTYISYILCLHSLRLDLGRLRRLLRMSKLDLSPSHAIVTRKPALCMPPPSLICACSCAFHPATVVPQCSTHR
ncbi:hypothetical protein BAUCODRAFT_410288 [Baudoinia panamericana UAMH 10762]|uniref:Uncharacterized protein n=1 Tax=Baudoinia panamericana (strain UAMH 10762) TaxID=717646 RepID=M2LTZ3_BAUPA|nr:uncharacterized protein BAUCODRAFT_410288 [Baudoinia panamericana UAMH 10762]EMC97992.1 hypothetical protein BAUCODRAFT_410288 [Baudoinia panamericana UAMH 10762]